MRSLPLLPVVAVIAAAAPFPASAQVPPLLHYQGRVRVSGTDFTGSGQFKFALVDGATGASLWSNDGTSAAGSQPASAVNLAVSAGLYSVFLGENMSALAPSVFAVGGDVRLRVWFNDGANGWQQMSPDQRVASVGYALMAATVPNGAITSEKIAVGAVTSEKIADGAVAAADLAPGAALTNLSASGFTGVPNGSMLLSAEANSASMSNAGYLPAGSIKGSDKWTAISGGTARTQAAGLWVPSREELLVWGGAENGFHYKPSTNTWLVMGSSGQPSNRSAPSAVWTGTEFIVWGGYVSGSPITYPAAGGRYNPATKAWTAMSTANFTTGRVAHTAVWTGTEMLVWGGNTGGAVLATGGRYNPSTNTWTAMQTTDGPGKRENHSAVWTGTEMIIWGGSNGTAVLSTGYRFNPSTNVWTALPSGGPAARQAHTALWTGGKMLIWGGISSSNLPNAGGYFDTAANSWSTMDSSGAPLGRINHSAVWTGGEMIIWGGSINGTGTTKTATGGRYNLNTNTWTDTDLDGAPAARSHHVAVWTGDEMILWSGNTGSAVNSGARYRSAQDLYLYQKP